MEAGQAVDDHLTDTLGQSRVALELIGQVLADNEAVAPLHDHEISADDVVVGAQQIAARRQVEVLPQHRQHSVFAAHVVGAGDHRAERRPAQHELAVAEAQQVCQVCVAAAELGVVERPLGAVEMVA